MTFLSALKICCLDVSRSICVTHYALARLFICSDENESQKKSQSHERITSEWTGTELWSGKFWMYKKREWECSVQFQFDLIRRKYQSWQTQKEHVHRKKRKKNLFYVTNVVWNLQKSQIWMHTLKRSTEVFDGSVPFVEKIKSANTVTKGISASNIQVKCFPMPMKTSVT